MIDQHALIRVLTEFPRHLASDFAVSDALHDLVDGVTEVLGISGAGISLAKDGDRLEFVTAANDRFTTLELAQDKAQAGACVEAHLRGEPMMVADLAVDPERWPAFAAAADAIGVVAVAGIPMRINGTRLGALNLYESRRHDWSDEEMGIAGVLAAMGSGYVVNSARLDQALTTAEQLREALDSRIIIEQAKGVLAGERNISMDDAFMALRAHARSHRASLKSVAEAVVNLRLRP